MNIEYQYSTGRTMLELESMDFYGFDYKNIIPTSNIPNFGLGETL